MDGTWTTMGRAGAGLALLLLLACAPPDTPGGEPAESDADPVQASSEGARALAHLEGLLLGADTLSLTYDVRASGAVEARLSGQLLREGPSAGLRTAGHFADETVNGALLVEDGRLRVSLDDSTTVGDPPAALWEALALGFTRMGILHNLARLTARELPDRAGGGVAAWVRTGEVRVEGGDAAGGINLVFEVIVDGVPSGETTLVLGSGGLPVERRQRVDFDGETMEVLERYTWIRVPVEPGTAPTYSF